MWLEQLYQIKYLLFIELSLLAVLAIFELIPFLILLALIILVFVSFLTFKYSILVIQILIFSILVDSFIPMKGSGGGTSLLFVEAVLALTLMISTIKFFMYFDLDYKIPNLISVWLPFLVWSLLTGLFVAIDPFRVASFWKNYFAGFFVFTLTYYSVTNRIQIKHLFSGIIIWGILLALIEFKVVWELGGLKQGLIGLFLRKNLLTLGWGRSNFLAAFFVLIIPSTIGYFLYTNNRKIKMVLTLGLVLMSVAMILTLSRGGIIALIVALIILSFKVLNKKTLIPMMSAISVIVIIVMLNPLTYVLINSISALETSKSVYSRINFYKDVWKAFLENPITGVGFGNLGYYAQFIIPYRDAPSAHNLVLGALGEIGIIGLFFYLSIFALLIRKLFKDYKNEYDPRLLLLRWSVFSAILGALVHSLVEPTFESLQFALIFWTISGIAVKLDAFKSKIP